MTTPVSEKYDIKRVHRELYAPSAKDFAMVDVPPMIYLAIDGAGDPNTVTEYAEAVEALFSVAYAVKFRSKKLGRDLVVAPLEGLWRAAGPEAFVTRDKASWSWTMRIAQPEWIDEAIVTESVTAVRPKGEKPGLDRLRLVQLHEGASVQILHLGSYDDEAPTLLRLHDEWMPQHGLTFNGDHHEIYLSDARRTAPEKLRTILRQPVRHA